MIVGAFDLFPAALVAGALLVLCLYALSPLNKSAAPGRVVLVVASVCLAATAFDLGARVYRDRVYADRPKGLIPRRWPPLPMLSRFEPGVRFEGEVYGDLAAMSGHKEWRERGTTSTSNTSHTSRRRKLPWRGRRGRLTDALRGLRELSPLRYIISGRRTPGPESVIERKFINGRRLLFMAQYARNRDLTVEDIRRHRNFGLPRETVGAMKRLADRRRLGSRSCWHRARRRSTPGSSKATPRGRRPGRRRASRRNSPG